MSLLISKYSQTHIFDFVTLYLSYHHTTSQGSSQAARKHNILTMSDLPSTYKACVYDEPGKISTKVVDLDMPEPGAGEVLINL